MRAIDNDLGQQVAIVSQSFATYLGNGKVPAPYDAWPIAVILRRSKQPETEKRFLAAWCLHFPRPVGGRYTQLIERYQKSVRSAELKVASMTQPLQYYFGAPFGVPTRSCSGGLSFIWLSDTTTH
jgi:hypothetical protein